MEKLIIVILLVLMYPVAVKTVHGRCSRFEYITKLLLFSFVQAVVTFDLVYFVMDKNTDNTIKTILFYVYLLIIPVTFYINLGNLIRRYHDIGKPSIFALFTLIPIAGWLLPVIAMFSDSQEGLNEYDESINYKEIFPEKYKKMKLTEDGNLTFFVFKDIMLFIKKENYKYTIIVKTNDWYKVSYDLRLVSNNFRLTETSKYSYYRNIKKQELINWINNYVK